jgi:hypothetical protein
LTQPPPGEAARASSIAAAEAPDDFIDAPPVPPSREWPPVGAYPGEPGHPETAAPTRDWPTLNLDASALPWPPMGEPATAPLPLGEPATAALEWPPDEPTTATWEWPPIGAYPGEPGYPDTEPVTEAVFEPVTGAVLEPVTEPVFEAVLEPVTEAFADADAGADAEPAGEVVEAEPVWHQPPPTGPFHARHEKPGEWHTQPPEHLAFEHSPPAEVQPGVQRDQATEAIPLGMLPQPWQVPFDPHTTEAVAPESHVRQRRTALWVSLALVLTLLIFGGGAVSAFLLLRDAENGRGAPDPATAVNRFMTAVYTQRDPVAAEEVVCREARDEQRIRSRVNEIKEYAGSYDDASFRWSDPVVSGQTAERATVTVQLTLTTGDEKAAQQQLTFTAVRKTSWLVCDVSG